MNKLFRIEITGDLPEADPDLGAHAHVASVKPVGELVQVLDDMGVKNVRKSIRVILMNMPTATAKLAEGVKGPRTAFDTAYAQGKDVT